MYRVLTCITLSSLITPKLMRMSLTFHMYMYTFWFDWELCLSFSFTQVRAWRPFGKLYCSQTVAWYWNSLRFADCFGAHAVHAWTFSLYQRLTVCPPPLSVATNDMTTTGYARPDAHGPVSRSLRDSSRVDLSRTCDERDSRLCRLVHVVHLHCTVAACSMKWSSWWTTRKMIFCSSTLSSKDGHSLPW